jgi:hypothetical protein
MNTGLTRHGPDPVSLVFGGLFLLVVAGWLVGNVFDIGPASLGWVAGATLVTVGVLGLWHTMRPGPNGPVHRTGPPRP